MKPVGGRRAAKERGEERKNGFVEVGGNDGMNRLESGDGCLQNGIRLGVQATGVEKGGRQSVGCLVRLPEERERKESREGSQSPTVDG